MGKHYAQGNNSYLGILPGLRDGSWCICISLKKSSSRTFQGIQLIDFKTKCVFTEAFPLLTSQSLLGTHLGHWVSKSAGGLASRAQVPGWGSQPQSCGFSRSGLGLRMHISNQFPGDAAGLGTYFGNNSVGPS